MLCRASMTWQIHWTECFALTCLHHLLVILDRPTLRDQSPLYQTASECQARLPMCPLAAMSLSQTLTPTPEFSFRLRKPVTKAAKNTGRDRDRRAPDRATPACALLSPKLFCSPPPLRSLTWESVVPPTHAWRKSASSGRQLCLSLGQPFRLTR